MYKMLTLGLIAVTLISCRGYESSSVSNNSQATEFKSNFEKCVYEISNLAVSRKQKISSIARKWTLGGARSGSGGIGRASNEAEIWSDIERSKLAVWENNEMKRCNSANTQSNWSLQNMPPPFSEIGKPSKTSNNLGAVAPEYTSAITINDVDICPLDLSLGSFSHSTSSGLNKICYYK